MLYFLNHISRLKLIYPKLVRLSTIEQRSRQLLVIAEPTTPNHPIVNGTIDIGDVGFRIALYPTYGGAIVNGTIDIGAVGFRKALPNLRVAGSGNDGTHMQIAGIPSDR